MSIKVILCGEKVIKASKIAATLSSVGTPLQFISWDSSHGDLEVFQKRYFNFD